MSRELYLTECPRDAMQGIATFIPTEQKIQYLNHLLTLGFDRLDFGSFVSEKAIPQLKDTRQVLNQLNHSQTKLLAIVANERGADEALTHDQIEFIGYPFSINNTFQLRNTGKSIEESLVVLESIQKKTEAKNKKLVVYLSMAFGNPYNEIWNEEITKGIAEIFQLCVNLGGTISGEHGIGLVQKKYLDIAQSKAQIDLQIGIKKVFDPNNILNPGKIFNV